MLCFSLYGFFCNSDNLYGSLFLFFFLFVVRFFLICFLCFFAVYFFRFFKDAKIIIILRYLIKRLSVLIHNRLCKIQKFLVYAQRIARFLFFFPDRITVKRTAGSLFRILISSLICKLSIRTFHAVFSKRIDNHRQLALEKSVFFQQFKLAVSYKRLRLCSR